MPIRLLPNWKSGRGFGEDFPGPTSFTSRINNESDSLSHMSPVSSHTRAGHPGHAVIKARFAQHTDRHEINVDNKALLSYLDGYCLCLIGASI